MPFPRQRRTGTHETRNIQTSKRLPAPYATLAALSAGLSVAVTPLHTPASAKPARASKQAEVLPGVRGWTIGSQTYIRARPSAMTPPVAKVGKRTAVFVWGKFDGWYRVETSDHTFGWVYHAYIKCPDSAKLKELSHRKAKIASARSDRHIMYGSPDLLRTYYARYKAPGALKGLEKHGIRLARTPVARPRTASSPQPRTHPGRSASAAPSRTQISSMKVGEPGVSGRIANRSGATTSSLHRRIANAATAREVPPAPAAQAITHARPAPARQVHRPRQPKNPRQNSLSGKRLASSRSTAGRPKMSSLDRTSSTKTITTKASPIAPLLKPRPAVRVVTAPQRLAVPGRRAAAPVRRPKQRSTRANTRRNVRYSRKSRKNRAIKPQELAPFSPEELLRAREEYLASRRKNPVEAAPPIQYGPDNSGEGPSEYPLHEDAPAVVTPSSYRRGAQLRSFNRSPVRSSAKPRRTKTSTRNAKPAVKKTRLARGTNQASRGGSPRDRYFARANESFGQGMASQALGYRGMPYRRGAASPSRGFDCSGLVYHLLRRRGLNPPRTSSGLASYGKSVSRGNLKAGDILLFSGTYRRGVSHVGIYIGEGKFVHAATSGKGVRVDALSTGYYARKFSGARRVK